MKFRILLIMFASLVIVGCGGSSLGSSGGASGSASSGTINPLDINISKDIQDGTISGYDSTDSIENQYLAIINYFRSQKITCNDSIAITGPSGQDMVWNTFLADSAEEHSEDMAMSNYYNGNHTGSGTSNDITGQTLTPARKSEFVERISRNGYTGRMTAENIAKSTSTHSSAPDETWILIMEGWMKSTHGHCSNIMNPSLTDFGMHESRAAVDANGEYKAYWTQDFGGQ